MTDFHDSTNGVEKQLMRVSELAVLYLDNNASSKQLEELNQLLKSGAQCRRHFVRLCYDTRLIVERLADRLEIDPHEQAKEDSVAGLSLLLEQEKLLHIPLVEVPKDMLPASGDSASGVRHKMPTTKDQPKQEKGVLLSFAGVNVYRSSREPKQSRWNWNRVTAAAMLAMFVTIGYFYFNPPETPKSDVPVSSFVASLVRTLDARWENVEQVVGEGGMLRAGKYTLQAGFAEIKLDDGARLLIEAPCTFELQPDNAMRLQRGRLVADVPAQAHGFTVYTASAKIVDYGTEFGVEARESGQSSVAVFTGEVEMASDVVGLPTSERKRLKAGQSKRVEHAGGKILDHPEVKLAFVRSDEFEAKVKANAGSAYHQWLAYSYQLRRDADLIAYYPFDNQDEDAGQLLNRAVVSAGKMNGQLGNSVKFTSAEPTWATGRWAKKGALLFNSQEFDHVLVDRSEAAVLNHLDEITIALWVKVTSPDVDNHLVTKRTVFPRKDTLNLVWANHTGPDQTPYSILFNTHSPANGEMWKSFETGSVLRGITGWTHIAVTFDGKGKMFYLNGEMVGSVMDKTQIEPTDSDLLIGGTVVHKETWAYLDGYMDELAIFKRVLSGNEIRHMYETGRP